MVSLSYFPVIQEDAELVDLISRAAWFLSFCPIDRIYVPIASARLRSIEWCVAPGMDVSIAKNFDVLRQKVVFVVAETESDLDVCMTEASIILRWKKDSVPGFVSAKTLAAWERGKKVLQVDPVAIRQEGSYYIDVGLHLLANKSDLIEENKRKFEGLATKLGEFDQAYLMATGPSVENYRKFDFTNALSIVCNSVILDEELMLRVRPKILVFADPIFHFGPSEYAATFRKKLLESTQEHDYIICIPFKYYALFVSALPELSSRTIGIPFVKEREFNFDLTQDFILKTTANILTFLMVPLATTFARKIGFLGCDGRPLTENTYFWNHNANTQFNDKMANIREVHPGFFNIDYNDYYLEHCQALEAQLRAGEAVNKQFISLGFSHIPALKSRLGRGTRHSAATANENPVRVIIVDPDGKNWSGHFMAYNEKLVNALDKEGCSVTVICSREIEPDILTKWTHFEPRLLVPSWNVGQADSDYHPREFENELLSALSEILSDAETTLLYLYAGSLEHAKAIGKATQKYSNLFAHVNLFWLSFRDFTDPLWVEQWRPYLKWLDNTPPRLVATVPTRQIQVEVAEVFGIILDVAPHPSTAVADEQALAALPTRKTNEVLTALFPAGARLEKGYDAALGTVRMLADNTQIKSILRHVATSSTPNQLALAPQDLPTNATLVEGSLSNEDFTNLFRISDFVVLPYTPDGFAKRTSGLLIDAIYHGLPAVVVEGTWLAQVVKCYGCGVVIEEATPEALAEGIVSLVADYPTYLQRTRDAAQHYILANSWETLARYMLAAFQAKTTCPRLVVIDLTNIGGLSATGQVKKAFFRAWPASRFLLASYAGSSRQMCLNSLDGKTVHPPAPPDVLLSRIKEFDPDVVYYRAVDNMVVHAFAAKTVADMAKPLVIHIMDDWPERLKKTSPVEFASYDTTLRSLFAQSQANLSIGETMSQAFEQRYGTPFQAFANAVDPAAFPPKRRVRMPGNQFIIRYTGALADDMTLDSVKDIAEAVEALPEELRVYLHIFTREPWLKSARSAFANYRSIRVLQQVPSEDYYALLQESDALIIAYNFDDRSRTYIGFSIANKMPEYLASGTPIIAYGPKDVATIDYLRRSGVALVIDTQDRDRITREIRQLVESNERQRQLAEAGRRLAFDRHNVWKIADGFRSTLSAAAEEKRMVGNGVPQVGAFPRDTHAHWDETAGIARLFQDTLSGTTMIDVGAHHGSALVPFLNRGWRIYAFEPDDKNRSNLLERLAKHKNKDLVSLDTRCVSNKAQRGVSFFTSKQSTGISGLSAFHESHVEAQQVDITTLTEFFQDKPMPAVDFLKIDTEGHDLFVLQGYPWERGEPAVIECEFEDVKTVPLGYTFHDLSRFLVDKGYTVYVSEWHPIVRYGIQHDWNRLVRYPCELADPKGWGNLLAFRDPIDEQALVAAVKKVLKVGGGRMSQNAAAPLKPAAAGQSAATAPLSSAMRGFRVVPGLHFAALAPNQWRYTHAEAKQKLWVAVMDAPGSPAGRTFGGRLRVVADRAMTVNVSLGRQGKTEYEGTAKRITLAPGVAMIVNLSKRFTQSHAALKLQLEVINLPGGGSAVLTIDNLGINESLASIRDRQGAENLDLRTANRLFREGEYPTALGIYLWLGQQRPLPMYGDNAVMAARRSGMQWVKVPGDLAFLIE